LPSTSEGIDAGPAFGPVERIFGNDKVRIPVPKYLESTARPLRSFGRRARLGELIAAIDRAAEAVIPMAGTSSALVQMVFGALRL